MLKKWKYGLYIILFSLTLTVTSIVGVLAVFNADIFNNIGITYTAQAGDATLMSGYEFNEILFSWASEEDEMGMPNDDYQACTLIVFDYYTEENRSIVENADKCTSVAEDGSDDILMYQVGETIYILSNHNILANENSPSMFGYMSELKAIEFNNFDTSNVTDMSGMFEYCSGLTSLDLSLFNTSNVTYMNQMFGYCSSLTSLDLSMFDTSNVANMNGMFDNCYGLTSLNLSMFDTSNVTDMSIMFNNSGNLTTIYVSSSWSTLRVEYSGYMFGGCSKLVGGNGTTYNGLYADVTYARIDTASTPGYFTDIADKP